MKDYRGFIELPNVYGFLNILRERGCDYFTIDRGYTHVINTENLKKHNYKIENIKYRKYMILIEDDKGSQPYIYLTDNDKVYEELYKQFEKEVQDIVDVFC